LRLEGKQKVGLPQAAAYQRLQDPHVLRACTPGLEKLEPRDADHYDAVLEVKLPAISGRFEGTLDFLERRPASLLRLRLAGKGSVGFVDGEVALELSPVDDGTSVAYVADVQVGGQVARLGQRMLSGVTREMAGQFFAAFERYRPEAPDAPIAPSQGRSLVQLVWRSLLRILGLRRD